MKNFVFPGSAPIFIGIDKGFLEAEGIKAEPFWFKAAQPIAVATSTGDPARNILNLLRFFGGDFTPEGMKFAKVPSKPCFDEMEKSEGER